MVVWIWQILSILALHCGFFDKNLLSRLIDSLDSAFVVFKNEIIS